MHSGDYQNVFKYDSPPFNPGVRQWYGVKPEQSIVNFPNPSPPNFHPYRVFPSLRTLDSQVERNAAGCGYPVPYSPPVGGERVEGFGSANTLVNLLVLILIIYLVYYLVTRV